MIMAKINELDDPWVIATDRAQQAGKLLARVLLAEHKRNKGEWCVDVVICVICVMLLRMLKMMLFI